MPRVNAKAKDSEWVRQRKAWETSKPADVNEVLLVTPEGLLLEGLTSNFFVLNAEGAVMTADEGVLSGTVRELILQVGGGVDLLFVTHSAHGKTCQHSLPTGWLDAAAVCGHT
jgi:branched-subunit amino acid aminotransferase/4-amino-4-deoxychorismate lyase